MATKKENEVLKNIRERSDERLTASLNTTSGRLLFAELEGVSEDASSLSLKTLMEIQKIILGDDFETVVKMFNDDANKLDDFVVSMIQSRSAKK